LDIFNSGATIKTEHETLVSPSLKIVACDKNNIKTLLKKGKIAVKRQKNNIE